MPVGDFYANGQGDRLVDPECYPEEIKIFLEEELRQLVHLRESFDLLVEVGCMDGRHLTTAIEAGQSYLGLDPVSRYIARGRQGVAERLLPEERYRFIEGNAEAVHQLVKPKEFGVSPRRTLLFFPFNSFGNMEHPEAVIYSLGMARLPFLISSYQTNSQASDCRLEYYSRCGFSRLEHHRDEFGVLVTSPDGLHTVAYHPEYLVAQMISHGLTVAVQSRSFLQVSYLCLKP